jgi:hypothetical protein
VPFKCNLRRYSAAAKKSRKAAGGGGGSGGGGAGISVGLCTLNQVDP